MTILSTECENCVYGKIDETNKAKIKIHCDIKNKDYYFGQYIPCDYFENNGNNIPTEENNIADSVNTIENISIKPQKRKRGRPKGSKNKKKK